MKTCRHGGQRALFKACVLGGFEIGTDAEIVKYPDRYVDEAGADFWNTVTRLAHETIETTLSYYVGRNAERTAAILWHEHEKATEPGRKADAKKPRGKRGKTST